MGFWKYLWEKIKRKKLSLGLGDSLVRLSETVLICPNCGHKPVAILDVGFSEYFSQYTLTTNCPSCHYRYTRYIHKDIFDKFDLDNL